MLKIFFLEGLRLNMASILSVTKPPTTLKSANQDRSISKWAIWQAVILQLLPANIVIPEIAFAPLIKGVWKLAVLCQSTQV